MFRTLQTSKSKTKRLRALPLSVAALTALTPTMSLAASVSAPAKPSVIPDPAIAANAVPAASEPTLSQQQLITALQSKVKYVFVLYQENRAFDHYFGTFPGAEGIFSSGVSGATDTNGNPVPVPRPVAKTPGYYQQLTDINGSTLLIHPFRIAPQSTSYDSQPANMFSADLDDLDHSHVGLLTAMDIQNGIPRMDKFAAREQGNNTGSTTAALYKGKQFGELAMAYVDGDTIPFLWQYANRFTLFDHIFQQTTGPSTPGNLSIFGAQQGITQGILGLPTSTWPGSPQFASTVFNGQPIVAGQVKTTKQSAASTPSTTTTYLADTLYNYVLPTATAPGNGNSGPGLPLLNDANPLWGSNYDGVSSTSANKQPYGSGTSTIGGTRGADNPAGNPSLNMTYATLAVTLGGNGIGSLLAGDLSPQTDLDDLNYQTTDINGQTNSDISFVTQHGSAPLAWGWYESGYGAETTPSGGSITDPPGFSSNPMTSSGLHASYIAHHDGPQYFGYIANNPNESKNIHPLSQFFSDLNAGNLNPTGGLYYLKGGYQNILNLEPTDTNTTVRKAFIGDDDHPAYSDSQIAEAQIATDVNAIASSKYWNNCAIIITWDDSEGDYDHVQPPTRGIGPDGSVVSDGPRVPLLVISPYAKTNAVVHDSGNHSSVVKFVDTLFGLTPLADLPAENYARHVAQTMFGLPNAGPEDDQTANISDLTSAFDPARLTGAAPALPPSYATIPVSIVTSIPPTDTHGNPYGLSDIGVLPTDYALGVPNQIPADFNPRPSTLPTSSAPYITP